MPSPTRIPVVGLDCRADGRHRPRPHAVALAWWTGLSPRERARYRQRISGGRDLLLAPHAHDLAAAGLAPADWWIVGPQASTADNDRIHRFELVLGDGRTYVMPDPVRRLVLADLDRTPLVDDRLDAPPRTRWWQWSRTG